MKSEDQTCIRDEGREDREGGGGGGHNKASSKVLTSLSRRDRKEAYVNFSYSSFTKERLP